MARVTTVTLDEIDVDVANAIVNAHVEVAYSRFDKDANTPYRMDCSLRGHDPGGEPLEDDVDDVIPNGSLTPVGGQIIRANGLDAEEFHFNATMALADLDEDEFTGGDSDEIKAHVQLTPIAPNASEAESGFRTLTIID